MIEMFLKEAMTQDFRKAVDKSIYSELTREIAFWGGDIQNDTLETIKPGTPLKNLIGAFMIIIIIEVNGSQQFILFTNEAEPGKKPDYVSIISSEINKLKPEYAKYQNDIKLPKAYKYATHVFVIRNKSYGAEDKRRQRLKQKTHATAFEPFYNKIWYEDDPEHLAKLDKMGYDSTGKQGERERKAFNIRVKKNFPEYKRKLETARKQVENILDDLCKGKVSRGAKDKFRYYISFQHAYEGIIDRDTSSKENLELFEKRWKETYSK